MFCKNLLYVVLFATHDYVASEIIDLVPSQSPTYLPQVSFIIESDIIFSIFCDTYLTSFPTEHMYVF